MLKMKLIDYTEEILEKSWLWLNDPEIKYLTNTPDFTREGQKKWFNSLPENKTYWVKGLELEGEVIGVVGLKNIDVKKETAEYFGYIGEKKFWGRGLSKSLFDLVFKVAVHDFKLKTLYLNVIPDNIRAIKAYEKVGFKITGVSKENVMMNLDLY